MAPAVTWLFISISFHVFPMFLFIS
jgi:hypothetical protein